MIFCEVCGHLVADKKEPKGFFSFLHSDNIWCISYACSCQAAAEIDFTLSLHLHYFCITL